MVVAHASLIHRIFFWGGWNALVAIGDAGRVNINVGRGPALGVRAVLHGLPDMPFSSGARVLDLVAEIRAVVPFDSLGDRAGASVHR